MPLSILNCSVGYENEKDNTAPIYEALTKLHNAGVAVFKSAGNDSLNLDDKDVLFPPQAQMKWRYVGLVDKNRHLAQHSNFGQRVSLFAPGEGIECHPGSNETEEGTSLAAGFVSGYAACIATDYGLRKPDDIFQMLDSLKIWSDSYKGIAPARAH